MDLSEINPSFNELLNQVNVVNFNDNEIDFQKTSSKNILILNHLTITLKSDTFFANLIDINGF